MVISYSLGDISLLLILKGLVKAHTNVLYLFIKLIKIHGSMIETRLETAFKLTEFENFKSAKSI